ncbi:MAG: hypothetical protein FJ167_03495 [Gammaproteobacteria bacterium]|nr:hypothetical protein [Gammaproteobacteria bacterium]
MRPDDEKRRRKALEERAGCNNPARFCVPVRTRARSDEKVGERRRQQHRDPHAHDLYRAPLQRFPEPAQVRVLLLLCRT